MIHPKYKIVQVVETNENTTTETVSKQLMFKCDAERVVKYQNQNWAIMKPDYKLYWVVEEYKKN